MRNQSELVLNQSLDLHGDEGGSVWITDVQSCTESVPKIYVMKKILIITRLSTQAGPVSESSEFRSDSEQLHKAGSFQWNQFVPICPAVT